MAIGVNTNVSRGDIASTTATTTITKPTGTASDDVLILIFGTDHAAGSDNVVTAPAGWTAIFTPLAATDGTSHIVLTGFWALGSVSALNFTNSQLTQSQGWVCVGFTGVSNSNPIDATGTTNSNTGAASLTTNAVTVASDQAWHVIGFASWLGGTNTATSFTVIHNVATPPATNADATILYNTTPKSVGSTGTVAVASSAASAGQILAGAPFALKPSVATPGTKLYTRQTYRPAPFRPGFGR